MDPDVISFDDLPDDNALPKAAAPQGAPDVIGFDDLPDEMTAQAPAVAPQASGIMVGIGSGLVRGFQNTNAGFNLAEKFKLIEYKNSLEKGGAIEESDEAQIERMMRPEQDARAAEIARVNARLAKLDEQIKESTATAANYPGKSMPYQALQQGIEQARKSTTPFSDFVVSARDNIAGVPELLAEGAYATGRPIVAAIASGLALRKGQARPIIQTLGPIAASMGVTGIDSYRSTVTDTIEQKAREGGIDLRKNPEMLGTLLTDADFIEAVKSDALKAGVNDAAWAGISTALGMSPRIRGIWQPVTQAGAEVATDLSNKVVRGKEIDTVDLGVAGVTGAAFEAPGYAIGRAIGAFGSPAAPATPGAPAAPQATPTPAAPTPTAAAPDVIPFESLPSVAGETVEPAAAEPAPAPAAPTTAPAQPQAEAPAPAAPAPTTQPQATGPDNSDAAYNARAAAWAERNRQRQEAAAQAQAAATPAPAPVEPRPKTPDVDAPQAEWDAYWPASKEWDAKHRKTHWNDGAPKRAEWVEGTPEYAAREAQAREVEARRAAEQQAQAATPPVEPTAQPAAPAPVAVEPEATPAPAPQPVATAQPAAPAQTEIAGTEDTFNLTGEQVAAPTTRAEDTTAEMPLEGAQESAIATEARARLAKLEAAGKGDSDQAKALRRTIERETQPAAEAPKEKQTQTLSPEAIPGVGPKGETLQDTVNRYKDLRDTASRELEAARKNGNKERAADASERMMSAQRALDAILDNAAKRGVDTTALIQGEGERQVETPAAEAAPVEQPNVDLAQDKDVSAETKAALAKANADVMAAFKKYGKKSQQYKDAQKAKKKIFEKALAEKSKALEAERDGQPNPRTDAENTATQSPQAEAAPVAQTTADNNAVPKDADETVETVQRLAGQKLSKGARSELATLSEEGLQPDFVDEGNIQSLKDHLNDLLERLDTALDAARTAVADGNDPKEVQKTRRSLNEAKKAVEAAVAKLDAEPAPVAEAAPAAEQPKREAKPRERKPDPKTGEPYEVTLARRRVDNPKTNPARYSQAVRILDQYENDQKLAKYDETVDLDKVSDEALGDFLDAHGQRTDATTEQDDYFKGVEKYAERRFGSESSQYGDLLADIRNLAKKGRALPVLPKWFKWEDGRIFSDIIKSKVPFALASPPLFKADEKRAKTDPEYRKDIKDQFYGMVEDYAEALKDLGWTQTDPSKVSSWDAVVDLVSRAADGERLAPEGGVLGVPAKSGNPRMYSTETASADPDFVRELEEDADTREPEPSDEDKQAALDMEIEYEDPRFDAEPTPADQAVLDAAADNAPTEQSILDALDKAAAERLDPRNRSSIGPDLIAALAWQTARDIQRGLTNFAKWAAEKAKQFPGLKGSLKAIWARAQDIAKRPMDYIRFRALDSIADKVWQNAGRNPASATLRKIANIVFAKSGPDADATENDIPTRINLVRNQFSNIYANIMERFAREFADMTPEQRRKWDADFRAAVIDGTTPSDPKVAQAVKDFRKLMRDMLDYQRNAGIEMGDQGANYFPRNYDADAVEADRDGFVAAAQEMYRKREERLLQKAIRDVRRAEKDRPAERRAADRKFGRKEKTDAEYQKEAAEWAQEKIAALQFDFDAKDDAYYKQKAEDWATAITHGDVLGMTLFKTSEGKVTSDSTDARTFTNDEAKLADAFLKKNIDDIMLGYIDGAVRGAEVGRVFGQDGSKFEQMMNKLSAEGVDKETVKETRRLVQKALGVGREQQSQATAAFFDWVNVVLAGAFLGKTFMYNLVLEPISFGIRTGNVYLALKSISDTWRYTIAEISKPSAATRQRVEAKYGSQAAFAKAVTETVAEQVGLIQNEMERAYFNSHWDYSSDEKGSKMAKWISQRIYRANLMSATERAKVRASIGIARLALRDNARFFTGDAPIQKLFKKLGFDTNADKSAAVILRENGVPDADHKAFAAWVAGLEGKTDAEWQKAVMDPKDPMAKHYRRALQRMSLGMSIKTNPALKMEMSDSVLGRLMMQLMNYSYAYSNLVKDRMYSMAAQTVAKDASTIDRLRYAAPLMVGAPLAILGAAASKALIAGIWPSDDEEKRSKETPMVRKAFNWASFAGMFGPKVEYLFKSFERGQAPGGPVGETIFRGGQAAFAAAGDPDSEKKAFNARKQLYNSTVKPVVTGAGAAVHPFFGFLGNAAVNTQVVRESVTGGQPRK